MNEWISVKEKPKEFMRVIMKGEDGKERWGVYDPESWITPWIFECDGCNPYEMPILTHWRPVHQKSTLE